VSLRTRLASLEASTTQRRRERPSPAAVIVCLAHAEPDPATLAEVEAWAKLPARERRQLSPWGIRTFET